MADAALDSDVLLKGVSYGILDALLAALPGGPYVHGILGTAKFVLPKALKKRPPKRFELAKDELATAFLTLECLEPDEDETAIAAKLEYEAQRQFAPLHVGECQLIAIMLARQLRHLLTGDRNAISAMAMIEGPEVLDPIHLAGKFICFEQAVLHLVNAQGARTVRDAICAERQVDTAMRVCFSCSSPEIGEESWITALKSHIENLRITGGGLLAL